MNFNTSLIVYGVFVPISKSEKLSSNTLTSSLIQNISLFKFFRRKRVGYLVAMKWRNPKFNSPEARNELQKFAEEIFDECSMPQVGFDLKGIVQHVRDFFNE